MTRALTIAVLTTLCVLGAQGSWYWPFDEGLLEPKSKGPRLSDLLEPATTNIDAAADFAAEGKFKEAQESYRAAIAALERIERENPERAATPEFASVRNKRAYINAALDAMLLAEARDNAKAVSVSDTTDLEMKIVLKPWEEFETTYASLTNADDLVMKRVACLGDSEMRKLLAAALEDLETSADVADRLAVNACVSNQVEIKRQLPKLETMRAEMGEKRAAARAAIERMQRFSGSVGASGGVRLYDVARQDARQSIAACTKAWPKYGATLGKINHCLEAVYELLPPTDEVRKAWGGEEVDVPEKEDDRGLVKNDGDARPDVTSQLDSYMDTVREHMSKVNERADQYTATRRAVQREIRELEKGDSKSRKARLLRAGEALRSGDASAARKEVESLLEANPNDCSALNLRAAIEAAEGDLYAAERTLERAIQADPEDYHACYNMANVQLEKGNVGEARRYYELGRKAGGKANAELEKAVKEKK